MARALFPGTFDPPTLGHLDVLRRAVALFGSVALGVAEHPGKEPLFDLGERLALLAALVPSIPGAEVVRVPGLVVETARRLGASVVVRGVRNPTDFDYEVEMARTNRVLAPDLDTVLLVPDPAHAHITSTLVRQIARMGGDTSRFVPPEIHAALSARFRRSEER